MGVINFRWDDVAVSINDNVRSDVKGILYKARQEKVVVLGSGNNPNSIQRGVVNYSGFIYLKASCLFWLKNLSQSGSILDLSLRIEVRYGKGGLGDNDYSDTLSGVEFIEEPGGLTNTDLEKEYCIPFVFLQMN